MMKKLIFIFISILLLIPLGLAASLDDCFITNSCGDTSLFKVSGSTNAHAGTNADSTYTESVCCSGIESGLVADDCGVSGNPYQELLYLSAVDNAHVEAPQTNYNTAVCLSTNDGSDVVCNSINGDCDFTGGEVCVAKISSSTNAHVSDCNSNYPISICCKVTSQGPPASGCVLDSVAIVSDTCGLDGCDAEETIDVEATFSGDCSSAELLQVDASYDPNDDPSDGVLCDIQYDVLIADIKGIDTPVASPTSPVTVTWTIPGTVSPTNPGENIPDDCKGQTITPTIAAFWVGIPGSGTPIVSTTAVTGSFTFAGTLSSTTTTEGEPSLDSCFALDGFPCLITRDLVDPNIVLTGCLENAGDLSGIAFNNSDDYPWPPELGQTLICCSGEQCTFPDPNNPGFTIVEEPVGDCSDANQEGKLTQEIKITTYDPGGSIVQERFEERPCTLAPIPVPFFTTINVIFVILMLISYYIYREKSKSA